MNTGFPGEFSGRKPTCRRHQAASPGAQTAPGLTEAPSSSKGGA